MNIKKTEQQLIDAIKKNNFIDFKEDVIFFLKNIDESALLTKLLLDHYLSLHKNYLASKNKIIASVIIPCHNYGLFLRDAVLSVLHQTFPYYEIIIVNDGSQDNSHSVATKILADFPDHYISYINQEQHGIVQPRNRGVRMARGKYILPLDADDMIAPDFLAKTVRHLDEYPEHGYVSTKALFFGDVNKIWPRADFHPLNLFITNQQTNTTLYRKEMWENIGGYDERMIHGYMDWEFWIRATKMGWTGYQIDEPLFFYRRKNNSVVMKAKNNDIDIKIQIMTLHPEVYHTDKINLRDPDLHKKNFIPQNLLRKNIKFPTKTSSQNAHPSILSQKSSIMNHGKKNILFVCHDFPPHKYAGAQLYAKHLAEEINTNNLAHIEIIYPVVRNKEKKDYEIIAIQQNNIILHEIFKPCVDEPGKVFDELIFKKFSDFLKNIKFDIIHFHGLGQLSLAPIFSAAEAKIPSTITLHDYWFLCDRWHMIRHDQSICSGPESIKKCADCFMEARGMAKSNTQLAINYQSMRLSYMKKAFALFAHRSAPSKFLADIYTKFGFTGIEVIPLGLSGVPVAPKRKTTKNSSRIGYTGQFIPRKGIDTLLQAMETLHNSSITLHVWGKPQDDPYGDDILKRIQQNPSVVYHGPFSTSDLEKIYSQIDLAIVPSHMENYPLTILEAFAHNTPVVATNVGGIPEIITNQGAGILVETGNHDQLASAILEALRPETYAQLCSKIPSVKNIVQDAHDYSKRYDEISSRKPPLRAKILFYFFKNVHIPILLPIYRALKDQHVDVEVGFSYLPPMPQIRAGLTPDELRDIEKIGEPIYATPQEFHPDLTFIADSVYPWVEGCGKLVHVGHGVLSKGQYYTDTPTARREELADMVCVPGKHHQAIMRLVISKPVVATGMCKLDDLFSGKISRQSVIKQFGLPDNYRYVLFAPTFNDELSAIPFITDRIGDVLPDDKTLLIIKLHPSTKPEYKEMYRTLPNRDKRVIYADELDITPFLALCDVMISDVSSAMMEFAALDKPVILFNNPNWSSYQNYNPDDIEFQWRDIGIQVASLDDMREAVALCLQDPRQHADKRKKYTNLLFANKQDGNAAKRIVKLALSLLEAEQNR